MDSKMFILVFCLTLTYADLGPEVKLCVYQSNVFSAVVHIMPWVSDELSFYFISNPYRYGALGPEFGIPFPPFLRSYGDVVDEETKAMNSLVAVEDVLKYWNGSHSTKDFGSSWIVLPNGNGTAEIAILDFEEPHPGNHSGTGLQGIFLDNFEEAFEKVQFELYTAENPKGVVFGLKNLDQLEFPENKSIKIICHGWRANGKSDIIQGLKDAYVAHQNVTVIGVDWSYGASSVIYNLCAKETAAVGRVIGELINSLVQKFNLLYEDFHIIGHSLGAHVAGFAGRHTERKIGRITGLDPALPGFQYLIIAGGRLEKSDADFVDVIHSCASSLGMSIPVGHVDFYPNGGSPFQPGCDKPAEDLPLGLNTLACSHARSYEFFEESIKETSDFVAVKCDSWNEFKFHKCLGNYTLMGDRVDLDASGIYYLKTYDYSPYYMGFNGTIF